MPELQAGEPKIDKKVLESLIQMKERMKQAMVDIAMEQAQEFIKQAKDQPSKDVIEIRALAEARKRAEQNAWEIFSRSFKKDMGMDIDQMMPELRQEHDRFIKEQDKVIGSTARFAEAISPRAPQDIREGAMQQAGFGQAEFPVEGMPEEGGLLETRIPEQGIADFQGVQ